MTSTVSQDAQFAEFFQETQKYRAAGDLIGDNF